MNRRDNRGRTLVELMVASALLLLLTASCAQAVRYSLDYLRRIEKQTEMENQLLFSLKFLTQDLGETSPRSVVWEPGAPSLTFATPRDASGQLLIDHTAGNRLLFGTLLCFQVAGTDAELRRYNEPLATPTGLAPNAQNDLIPAHLSTYFLSSTAQYKVLAKGVTEFTLQPIAIDLDSSAESTTTTDKAVRYDIRLKVEHTGNRQYAVWTDLGVVPRN